jgi:hypothetical protein
MSGLDGTSMTEPTTPEPRAGKPDLTLPCGLLLIVVGLAAGGLGFRAWLALNDREPLLAGLPAGGAHEREVPPPRQVRRAVLIIADGVDAELALSLPTLRRLAGRGIQAEAVAAGPTFSRASYVTWLAGLDPVDSGVRTNRYRGALPLDSLPSRARAGGLRSLGYDEGKETLLADLFGPHLTTKLSGAEAWPQALAALRGADLSLLALLAADEAGHLHGAASQQYRDAADLVAHRIGEVAAALDLEQDLLVVVNDHGQLPGGGHGGMEPAVRRLFLVGAGAGLGRGLKLRIDQKDLAPTLAHLLGLLPPAHNRGWSLGWALDPGLDPFFFEAAFATQYPGRHRVERFLAEELRVSQPPGRHYPRAADLVRATVGNLAEARRLGWHMLQVLQQRVDSGQRARLKELRVRRGIFVGLSLVLVLALMIVGGRLRLLSVRFGGSLLALLPPAAVVAALYLLDVRLSLSPGGPRDLWLLRMLGAAGGAALVHAMLAFMLPGQPGGAAPRAAPLGRVLAAAWLVSAVALAGFVLAAAAPGSALPTGRVLAGAVIAWVCWVGYLLTAGLALSLIGLRRVDRAHHS